MKEITVKRNRLLNVGIRQIAQSLAREFIGVGEQVLGMTLKTFEFMTLKTGRRKLIDSPFFLRLRCLITQERGDVPGWVLVVLMTTGLVTAIWAIAAPKLNLILKNSLDSMGNIR